MTNIYHRYLFNSLNYMTSVEVHSMEGPHSKAAGAFRKHHRSGRHSPLFDRHWLLPRKRHRYDPPGHWLNFLLRQFSAGYRHWDRRFCLNRALMDKPHRRNRPIIAWRRPSYATM